MHLMSPHSHTICILPLPISARPRFNPSICSLTLRNTASLAPIRRFRSSSAIGARTDLTGLALLFDDDVRAVAFDDGRAPGRSRLVAVDVQEPARVRPHGSILVETQLDDL